MMIEFLDDVHWDECIREAKENGIVLEIIGHPDLLLVNVPEKDWNNFSELFAAKYTYTTFF